MLSLYLVPEETSLQSGALLTIEGDEAHHIVKVARHRIGERIWVTNGVGVRATLLIENASERQVHGIVESITIEEVPPVRIRVIQALTKSDRAHECIELLVAAGVDEIVPWRAERSIGKWDTKASPEKWNQWIKGAVKQSRRVWIPSCEPYLEELSLLPESDDELFFAFHEEADASLDSELLGKWRSRIESARRVTLIIGPEGGLSERELAELERIRIPQLRLGSPVFRSAHAGAIAATALQATFALWR